MFKLLYISVLSLILTTAVFAQISVLPSGNPMVSQTLATNTPVAGYVLKTDGTVSYWGIDAGGVPTNDPIYLMALTNITEVVLTNAWSWNRLDDHNIRLFVNTNDFGSDIPITNMLSSDGSIVWLNSGGLQPDGSVTNYVYNQLLSYVPTNTANYLMSLTNITDIVFTNNWGWNRIDDRNIQLLVNTNHEIESITGLQTALEGKSPTNETAAIKITADGAVQRTGETNTLDLSGADVRIATGMVSNQPVTKAQLDTVSGINTNTGYTFADGTEQSFDDARVRGDFIMPSMNTMAYTGAVPFLAWNPDTGLFEQSPHKMETYSRTITVTNGGDIQAAIDGVGTYLPSGANITIQLDAGTYSMTNSLRIQGFTGGGSLVLCSTDTVSSAYRTQSATLDFSGSGMHGILVQKCAATITIRNLRIIMLGDTQRYAIFPSKSHNVAVNYNSITEDGVANQSLGIYGSLSTVGSRGNIFDNLDAALYPAQGSYFSSRDDAGTNLNYSGRSTWGSICTFFNTNTLDGTFLPATGGLLILPDGATLP